jgi:hypothetical protein
MPPTGDRRAQIKAIGSHSKECLPEEPPHETTSQVDYNCSLQRDNKEAVRCSGTSENHKEKHSSREESHATSPLRRTDHRGKEQGDSATPDILKKEHVGRITIRNDQWPMTQKQSEKQAWQRTVCQNREQHMATRMVQIRRTEQHLSDSPSLTSSLENCSDTATSTSAFANTITALSMNSNHLDEPQPQLLSTEAKTQGFQGMGIGTINELPMDRWGLVTHHHTRKENYYQIKELSRHQKLPHHSKSKHTLLFMMSYSHLLAEGYSPRLAFNGNAKAKVNAKTCSRLL